MDSTVILGVFLALVAASGIALSMVIQRFALLYPPGTRITKFGVQLPRLFVWVLGLVVYAFANGFYAISLQLGPLSLIASIFTTLLVFNLCFARAILKEQVTLTKAIGSMLICIGVVFVAVGTPSGVQTDFTPSEAEDLFAKEAGATYFALLILMLLTAVGAIMWYEQRYPQHNTSTASQVHDDVTQVKQSSDIIEGKALDQASLPQGNETTSDEQITDLHPSRAADVKPLQEVSALQVTKPVQQVSTPEQISEFSLPADRAPKWLDSLFGLVYPGSLGIDEGICHLSMKIVISMLSNCSDDGSCTRAVVILTTLLWISASIATLWWLKVVFERYDTTLALPVEYGTVSVASICTGLVFFREGKLMEPWQLALSVTGIFVIVGGIQITRLSCTTSVEKDEVTSASEPPAKREV